MAEFDVLDRALRTGLGATTESVRPPDANELAARLSPARARRRRRRNAGRALVAAIGMIALFAAVVVWPRSDPTTFVDTGPGPGTSLVATPISRLGPGWHELDTGPVPSSGVVSLASTDEELVVANDTGIYALGLTTGEWRKLDDPPFAWRRPLAGTGLAIDIVGVGRDIVAVQRADRSQAARLDPSSGRWSELGVLPPKDRIGYNDGQHQGLVFTGTHVFDLWNGAVLDLATATWTAMARPGWDWLDTSPVWTGFELVLTSWGPQSGWAWSGDGQSVRPIDPPPEEVGGVENEILPTAAVGIDGRIVVTTDGSSGDGIGGRAAELDPLTGNWSALPSYGGASSEGCPGQIANVTGVVILEQCLVGDPLVFDGGAWRTTGPAPLAARGRWETTAGALVSWSSPDDGPDSAAVWVPERAKPDLADTAGALPGVLSTVTPLNLAAMEPGWHDIDTTGLTEAFASSMVWTGEQLIVALNRPYSPTAAPIAGPEVLAFTPAQGTWERYAPPPFTGTDNLTLVQAGKDIVAVEEVDSGAESAILDLRTGLWTDLGIIPVPPALSATGASIRTVNGNIEAVWTGTHLLDITHGAVLNPETRAWSALPLPSDLIAFSSALYAEAGWTGSGVRMIGWGNGPALEWSQDGTQVRDVPNVPRELATSLVLSPSGIGIGRQNAVVVVQPQASTGTNAVRYDFAAGSWEALPPLTTVDDNNSCPGPAVQVDETFVIRPCYDAQPQLLVNGTWQAMPGTLPPAAAGVWLGTDVGLFTWKGADGSEANDPKSLALSIWIPPR